MKKLYFSILLIPFYSISQFNYQSILRDNNGTIIANTSVSYKISFIYDSSSGTPIYTETHSVTIPSDGVINIVIGTGTVSSGVFNQIDWSKTIYVKREVDTSGSGTYTDFGTSLLNNVPKSNYSLSTQGLTYSSSSNTVTMTNLIVSNTVTASAFVGDGSGLTNLNVSGPTYKSSMVLQSSSTAAADSQIDLPGMSFRWNSGKLEIKGESGNNPQAMIFYFSYHTNSGNTVNFRPDTVGFSTSSWSPVDCSWCSGSPNLPSITGYYAVYEFDFSVYPLNTSGKHYGRTYNIKILLGGWGGVHMRAFYQ